MPRSAKVHSVRELVYFTKDCAVIITRYLSREILFNTAAVSLVLLLILLSARFVKYLADAAAGRLDPGILFSIILYRVPGFLELILPLSLFISLLLVFGRLYLDNEIRVMFAAGMTRLQLLGKAMVPVSFVAVAVAVTSLYITPEGLARVELMLSEQKNRSELDSLQQGQFQRLRGGRGVIYTEAYDSDEKQMRGVYIFQRDYGGQSHEVVLVADQGAQQQAENGRFIVLSEGNRYRFFQAEQVFERIDYERYGQRIHTREEESQQRKLEQDALPTRYLMNSAELEHKAALQWRISVALLVPIIALLAIALSKTEPRQGRYAKLFPAILIYLFYLVLLNVARQQVSGGGLPPEIGLWPVHGIFLLLAIVLFNFGNIQRMLRREKR